MNYANKEAMTYQIAKAIFEKGPLSVEQIAGLMPEKTLPVLRNKISCMCVECDLEKVGETFRLQPHVRRHFAALNGDVGEVAGSRMTAEFKPLSEQHKFWKAPRREPIREDMSFKTGSVGFPVGLYA